MKQTAVEWFFWKLYILKEVEYESIMQLYEQAKAMEKEQIIDAYWDGGQDVPMHVSTCEQYYNITFKSE